MRAYRRVVSSSWAATTHFGGLAASGVPGAMTKRVPRAPRIFAPLIQQADRAEQSRQHRAMQIGVIGRGRVALQIQILRRAAELGVQVLPLAHAHEGQEILAAPLAQCRAAQSRGLLLKPLPQASAPSRNPSADPHSSRVPRPPAPAHPLGARAGPARREMRQ